MPAEVDRTVCVMQYMGAQWPGQYSEGHPGMHSTPMAPSWYQGPGEELILPLKVAHGVLDH